MIIVLKKDISQKDFQEAVDTVIAPPALPEVL
jgi:hypothetical protein